MTDAIDWSWGKVLIPTWVILGIFGIFGVMLLLWSFMYVLMVFAAM